MVNDEWSGAEALENAFRVADQELRRVERERDEARGHLSVAADRVSVEQVRAQKAERERDEWKARAEKAEPRTAPAVSYEHLHQEVVAAYEYGRSPTERVEFIVKYMCALFGVEAEQATDPVEDKARAEADRRYSGDPNHAFIEGAVWAARHVLGQEVRDA